MVALPRLLMLKLYVKTLFCIVITFLKKQELTYLTFIFVNITFSVCIINALLYLHLFLEILEGYGL